VSRLEDLRAGALISGLAPDGNARVIGVEWHGDQAVKVFFEAATGQPRTRLVYRSDEPNLSVVRAGRPWSFDGDGALLRLVSEAQRIRLAYLFDPYLAVTTSRVDPLPHQITAVYGELLHRQPLRFLLADDPGAGKTIMAGLFIKELLVRGDLERCLIVPPGNLVEQWQDELAEKFDLHFDILTRDQIEASRTGNPFEEKKLLIARLDMVARNEDLREKLRAAPEWDLVICDEAHKMSATHFGGEVKHTQRYQLGQVLGGKTRHLLLLTATPHNGKEEDFQLFMALLDGDRFEGKFRDGVHTADTSDMMRRLVKEELLKFDGKPLFPERRAYTVPFKLSDAEAELYADVTTYVREEMNRAERFADNDEKRKVNVGFALQILQRRLASSPEAIYQSIRRRRERLEKRLQEEKLLQRGQTVPIQRRAADIALSQDEIDEIDDLPEGEVEEVEESIVDQSTAAQTIAELETEILTLKRLEAQARAVRLSGKDTKWTELNTILDHPLMTDENGNRRKLIVFTESRDTLNYLAERISTRLGKPEAIVIIHGGVGREDRRKAVESFTQDKDVLVLVANDAAGEGVNLQRAHLMVNYDLPWNPNKLEQRFGRIHRIGQREVCHLWNLVAHETREGEVYERLLVKLEVERAALKGRVFDVLGRLFEGHQLRDLLVEAIRYGDSPEVKARLEHVIDMTVDRKRIAELLDHGALVRESMSAQRVAQIREDMERAEARRLQPGYIRSFFLEAFERLGGRIAEREPGRYEITSVPGSVRERDRQIGIGAPVLPRYERITFDKHLVSPSPRAEFICPGHPLLDSTLDLTLERYRDLLKRGAVLVDDNDEGTDVRLLFYLEHSVQDGRQRRDGSQFVISQRMQYVEMAPNGATRDAGPAPYLDYRPVTAEEREHLEAALSGDWLHSDFEHRILSYAIQEIVPKHVEEVRAQKIPLIDKTEEQVAIRLKKEINYWDRRAEDLRAQEMAGKKTRLSSSNARARAEDLAERLQRRLRELNKERDISALPPMVKGGAIVVPKGLLRGSEPLDPAESSADAELRRKVELAAMAAVLRAEEQLGRRPRDVSKSKGIGYDVESSDPRSGLLYFIEVKGRWIGRADVTLTKTEIHCSRNKPEQWRLALVVVDESGARRPRYLVSHEFPEPGFAETTRTFHLPSLLERSREPQ
jgi:superfamily II DNA or RNA helicase